MSKVSRRDLIYERERLLLEISEALAEALERAEITRSALAKRLGRHKSWITKILSHESNPTVKTLADLSVALDLQWRCELVQRVSELGAGRPPIGEGWESIETSQWTTNQLQVPASDPDLKLVG